MSTLNNTSFPDCLRVPLVVGVSGHIDILTPESEIEKRLDEFWKHLWELVPNTPLILLSSIAAGADHLAVKYRPDDVKYIAVLPFDEAKYRKTFSAETLPDFENDLENAYKVIRCNADSECYTKATDYIRQHSDVLLTMWDGYESLTHDPDSSTLKPREGGTYYQILTAFHKTPQLEFKEKVHLVVNLSVKREKDNVARHRENGEKDIGGFSEECSLSVLEWDEKPDSTLCKTAFKDYNAPDVQESKESDEETTDAVPDFSAVLKRIRMHNDSNNRPTEQRNDYYLRNEFENEIKKDKNNGPNAEKCFKLIEDDFIRLEHFDGLAGKHQGSFRKGFLLIGLLSVAVGLLGQAWGDINFSSKDESNEPIVHLMILIYLFGVVILWGIYRIIKRNDHYSKYVKPRLIAEMLRLKIFWKLAGIEDSFSDCFLKECFGYWFMLAVCNWELWEAPLSKEDQKWLAEGNGLETVKKFWVEDQKKYYEGYLLINSKRFIIPEKGERCNEKSFPSIAWIKAYFFNNYERCDAVFRLLKKIFIWGAFLLSIILLVVYVYFLIFPGQKDPSDLPKNMSFFGLFHYREFIVGVCPFIVATLGWIMEKHPWSRIVPQYKKTLNLFRKTKTYLEDNNHSDSDKRKMIRDLIIYAHQENREWNNIRIGAKPEPMI